MSELKSVTYKLIGGGCGGREVNCIYTTKSITAINSLGVEETYIRKTRPIFGKIFLFMVHEGCSDEWINMIVNTEISAALEHIGGARVSK